ncbi:MAG: SprT-like domain-containing protein [Lentisphaerota bacterium]
MTTPQAQVLTKCKAVFEKAKELYGVDLSKVAIRFDLKGRVGGMACARGSVFARVYHMRFNYDMLLRETDEMVDVVVPHEIAHIVCFLKPELGRNHDYGWARVCRALGGTGDRTHDMDVVYGKGTTYEYTTDRGHKVRLNDRRHQHVQSGRTLSYRKGLGTVNQQCAYSIVGAGGRSFAAPIVKKVAVTKEVEPATIIGVPYPAPVVVPVQRPAPFVSTVGSSIVGTSKAAISRNIMLTGHRAGHSYEQIITAMMAANGYTRQLARATYLANAPKVGIPI